MSTLTDIKIKAAMKRAKRNRLPKDYFAKDIQFEHDIMLVVLNSGYVMAFQLKDFPRLQKASKKQRSNWELISNGVGIHWKDIDEDLSVEGLIKSYIDRTSKFTRKAEKLVIV